MLVDIRSQANCLACLYNLNLLLKIENKVNSLLKYL